jgi:TRAP-type uncharacterized transport system substrate-binding protein
MTKHGWKWLIFPLAVLFLLASADLPTAFAKGGGGFSGGGRSSGFSGGGGFRSSPSFSPKPSGSSSSVFGGRSGGGIHGGYAKPGMPASPGHASAPGGYAKPGTAVTPGPVGKQAPGGSGYQKPGAVAAPAGGGGYQKPGAAAKPDLKAIAPAGKPIGSAFDKGFSQKMQKERAGESLKQYKADQAKFKQSAKPAGDYKGSPIYQNAQTYSRFDYGNYSTRQTVYYRNAGWSPPTYVYMGSPNYGMWNFAIWWMILDHHHDQQYSRMAYNQANDPGYRQWREDAEKRAEKDKDMREKLDKLDAQVKKMEQEGKPRDPAYLPPGMPVEAALAADVLAKKDPLKPKLRFSTGPKDQNYDLFGQMLKKEAGNLNIEVQLLESAGGLENTRRLSHGETDAALVPSDVLALLPKNFPGKKLIAEQSPIYQEVVQMIANTSSKVKSVGDLDPKKHVIYTGPEGSGTSVTWKGFCLQDKAYEKIRVKHADYSTALREVVNNPNAVMMFVSGLNSKIMEEAEALAKKTGKLRLVTVNDRHFDDKKDEHGNKIYNFVEIPPKVYPALQKEYRGWIWDSNTETLAVQAVLVLNTEWLKSYGEDAMDALSFAVLQVAPEMNQKVGGLK